MIRMAGAVLLTAGSAVLGLGGVAHLEKHVRDLRGIINGLEAMKRVLTAHIEPLEGMLSEAAQDTDGRPKKLFEFCVEELKHQTGNFAALWNAALDTVPLCLDADDVSELRQVGAVLGRFDADSQAAAFEQTLGRLERKLEDAIEQRIKMGKVYGTTGISAGLLLTILLF